MDPAPSDPSAAGTIPAATAAALPPEDPPALFPRQDGVLVGPIRMLSAVPLCLNSGTLVLPIAIKPARSTRSTLVVERGGVKSRGAFRPNVGGVAWLQSGRSFQAIGTRSRVPRSD